LSPPVPAVAIVPAAGKAERFGGGKLLADVRGEPLLNRTIRCLLDGGVDRVVVVCAPGADLSSVPLLSDPRVLTAVNPDPSRGMLSSIQSGLAAATGDPIVILPGDMPFVSSETVSVVCEACRRTGRMIVLTHEGRRGHPIALPASLRAAILRAKATADLSSVLKSCVPGGLEIEAFDPGILRDVDVPGDLAD
jgi:molybdenum cofactor cytidylyltransferase